MREWQLTHKGMESTEYSDMLAEKLEPIVNCGDLEAGSAVAVSAIASNHGLVTEEDVRVMVESFMESKTEMLLWSMVARGLLRPYIEDGEVKFENTDKARVLMEDEDG